jgi:L,D-transpeptidase YcbB
MRTVMIAAIATMLASTSGFGQSIVPSDAGTPTPPEKSSTTASKQEHARATTSKTTAASTPESRSAAALALSREPTYRRTDISSPPLNGNVMV